MVRPRGLEPPDVISTIFVVAARGRNVSSPTISANQREFPQLFQPFRENDICEFESSQPSHAVGLELLGLACDFGVVCSDPGSDSGTARSSMPTSKPRLRGAENAFYKAKLAAPQNQLRRRIASRRANIVPIVKAPTTNAADP
jgi:hypothetical protein